VAITLLEEMNKAKSLEKKKIQKKTIVNVQNFDHNFVKYRLT